MNLKDLLIVVLLILTVAACLYLLHRHPEPHTPAIQNHTTGSPS